MIKKIFQVTLLTVALAACDTIDEPYTEVADQLASDVVLIEFTGMKCVYCPQGHAAVEELIENYGEKIHPIAVHAGEFAEPDSEFPVDFRCDAGDKIYDQMEPLGFPSGTVNSLSGEDIDSPSSWASAVASVGKQLPRVLMTVSISIADSVATADITARSTTNLSGDFRLCVYLTEDRVIGKQKNGSEIIEDYEHNHILRAAFGDVWGTSIILDTKIEKQFTLKINSNWNEKNLGLVAFVYDKINNQILPADIMYTE